MKGSFNVNTSPSLTFAKLNMNGDNVGIDTGKLNRDNVRQVITGGGITESDERIVIPLPKTDEDRIFELAEPAEKVIRLTEDAKIILEYCGESAIQRVIRVASKKTVNVIEVTKGCGGDQALCNTRYILEEGSRLKLIRIQILDKGTLYIDDLKAVLEKDSYLEVVRIDLGAHRSYIGSHVLLDGKNAEYKAQGDYLLNGDQRLDINMIADHIAPDTVSDMRYDGVLIDSASKLFRGTLDFKSGCKGAKGSENEEVILLSEDVINQSLPIILCGEEDVEGNHGASVGKISDEIIYYLATRGFDEESATKLIIRSKFNEAVSQIEDEKIRGELTRRIDEVLK